MCSRCVPQRRDLSGALRRGLPLRVPSRGLRASVLHSHSPVLPAKVFRHVPWAETEIPPDHLINVSGLKGLSVVFECSFLLPFPSVLFCNHRSSLFHARPLVEPLVFTLICLFHLSLRDRCCHPWFLCCLFWALFPLSSVGVAGSVTFALCPSAYLFFLSHILLNHPCINPLRYSLAMFATSAKALVCSRSEPPRLVRKKDGLVATGDVIS